MPLHLLREYERLTLLSTEDRQVLEAVSGTPTSFRARTDLVGKGKNLDYVYLVIEGWLCRYKEVDKERRQIIALMLPGDLCDTYVFVSSRMDHSICTLTPARVAMLPRAQLEAIAADNRRLDQALRRDMMVTAAIQREWTVNLGQRTAFERIGHLFCELFLRMKAVGLTEGTSFTLPITQADLANTLGLSVIHTNRTLRELRRAGLIVLKARTLTIPNFAALKAASAFNPAYLHLDHEGRRYDEDEAGASA